MTDSGRGDTDTPEGEAQYTDSTGIDLTQFIINTLNKNIKDRVLMLKLEQEMTNLVKDCKRTHHKFPHMSSYHRMLVHRQETLLAKGLPKNSQISNFGWFLGWDLFRYYTK